MSVTAEILLIYPNVTRKSVAWTNVTWTNVTRTNVAWTNVTVTVGICSGCSRKPTFNVAWIKLGHSKMQITFLSFNDHKFWFLKAKWEKIFDLQIFVSGNTSITTPRCWGYKLQPPHLPQAPRPPRPLLTCVHWEFHFVHVFLGSLECYYKKIWCHLEGHKKSAQLLQNQLKNK